MLTTNLNFHYLEYYIAEQNDTYEYPFNCCINRLLIWPKSYCTRYNTIAIVLFLEYIHIDGRRTSKRKFRRNIPRYFAFTYYL